MGLPGTCRIHGLQIQKKEKIQESKHWPDSSVQKQRLLRRISNGYGSGTTFRLQEYRRDLSLLEGKAEDGRGDGVEEKGRIKMKSWKAIKDIFIGGINYEKEDYR